MQIASSVTLGAGSTIRLDIVTGVASTLQVLVGGTVRATTSISASAQSITYVFPHSLANNFGGEVSAVVTVRRVVGTSQVVESATTRAYIPPTQITSVTSPVNFGGTESVTFAPTATSLKYGVLYQWGTLSVWSQGSAYIEPSSTNPYTDSGTIPLSWADRLDVASDTINIWLVTYTSANKEVGRVSKTAKANVPTYQPTFTKTISEGTASGFGVFTQSYSTVRVDVTDMVMSYNSMGVGYVTTVSMTVEGITYTKTGQFSSSDTVTLTSNKLKSYGTMLVIVKITDSRGKSRSEAQSITVYQYHAPQITNIDTSISGTTVTVTIDGKIAPVANQNTKMIQVDRMRTSDQEVVNVVDQSGQFVTLSSYSFTYTFTETVADVETYSWEYIVRVKDSKTTTTGTKSTGIICISRLAGGLGVRLFAPAEEEGFWIRDVDYTISDAGFLALARSLAETYSTSTSYAVGDYCIRSSTLYRCKTATSGTWSASNWEVIS